MGLVLKDAYIERCDKETEETYAVETEKFLQTPVHYLMSHKNEFIYVECGDFSQIGIDGISLEMDDVFQTYDVMFGLKMPKKKEKEIRSFFAFHLKGEGVLYDLLYDGRDQLWNVNFTLNAVQGFDEDMSLRDAYELIYELLQQLCKD